MIRTWYESSLYVCDQVQRKSHLMRVSLELMTSLYFKKEFWYRHQEEVARTWWQSLEWYTPQSKEHQDESPLRRVKQGFSLGPLVTLWFGVSDLQDQETIKFCSLKHPVYSNLCLKLKKSVYPSKLYILVVLNLQCLIVLITTILVSPNTKAKPTTGTRCFETYIWDGLWYQGSQRDGQKASCG